MEEIKLTRINKFLSEAGYCSRRAADKLIDQGRVTINGVVPEMGTKIAPNDEVRVDGKLISESKEKPVYLAFNKPIGIVCTTDTKVEKDNIIDYINYPTRIFPIGRLDKPSEGLIFLTNDGDIVNKILRARNNHEKEYLVTVDKPITKEFIQKMSNGIPILDTVTRNCQVEHVSKFIFKIILTQGLNRQIRRMCEYLEYEVVKLKRVRIMNISLDMPVGKWRDLTKEELKELVDFARKNKSIIIFDAAYSEFIKEKDLPRSIFEIEGARECAIEVSSLSKPAGFTGVRLGWTIVPKELKFDDGESVGKDWQRVMGTLFNGSSNIAQWGAIAALSQTGLSEIKETVNYYMENAKIIKDGLERLGIKTFGGVNSPYIWAAFPGKKSWDVFEDILTKAHVVTTPGAGFGKAGEGFIRFSAFGKTSDIKEAVSCFSK